MDGLERLIEGRTTFVIAHRLATVRNADLVAVVQEGRLVETGTPAQLLAGDTIFAALARTQTLIDQRRPRSSVTRR
jgi:ABC-type multidrug transport system fused ATPase/permease subunit